jgi:RNA polymerase sigma factor (TIGR02999 family)
MDPARDVTMLLRDWGHGSQSALDELLPIVYAELRQIAARQLRKERSNHTLPPTALVHEAFLRLLDQRRLDWHDRGHFFGVVAQVMRRILVDYARRHRAGKRGEGQRSLPIDEAGDVPANEQFVLALDAALERLRQIDPELTRIVELRIFAGLTIEETARALAMSPSTAKREWRTARAWLSREIGADRRL